MENIDCIVDRDQIDTFPRFNPAFSQVTHSNHAGCIIDGDPCGDPPLFFKCVSKQRLHSSDDLPSCHRILYELDVLRGIARFLRIRSGHTHLKRFETFGSIALGVPRRPRARLSGVSAFPVRHRACPDHEVHAGLCSLLPERSLPPVPNVLLQADEHHARVGGSAHTSQSKESHPRQSAYALPNPEFAINSRHSARFDYQTWAGVIHS